VEIYKRLRGVTGSTGGVFVGPFSLGVVIGRLGCLFAGLPDGTYGTPTACPGPSTWATGSAAIRCRSTRASRWPSSFLAVYLVGLQRRSSWALRRGFYAMCIAYGVQRFAWEVPQALSAGARAA
jgi:hypothetical protein